MTSEAAADASRECCISKSQESIHGEREVHSVSVLSTEQRKADFIHFKAYTDWPTLATFKKDFFLNS